MDFYSLKIFLAVVETGSFTRAAKKLNCVQPNVTAHIKKLENTLGTQLFYRENRQITLTAPGREFVRHARQIFKLVRDTETQFLSSNVSGVLNLGVTQTVATAWLPRILRSYIQEHPDVEINVQSMFVETMTTQLLNHELDCVLTDSLIEHPHLDCRFSKEQRLTLVRSTDTPQTPETGTTILSFSKASHYRAILLDHLRQQHITVARELILKGMDAVLACVIGGVGISLLPEAVVRQPHISPYVKATPLTGITKKVGIVTHRNNVETAAQKALIQTAQSIINQDNVE